MRRNDTEKQMWLVWRNFRQWQHWMLALIVLGCHWQVPVQPVANISSNWRHFRFSAHVTSRQRRTLNFYTVTQIHAAVLPTYFWVGRITPRTTGLRIRVPAFIPCQNSAGLWEPVNHIFMFYHFSTLKWRRSWKSFSTEDRGTFIPYFQHHSYWSHGDARIQDISGHSIDLFLPGYSSLSEF